MLSVPSVRGDDPRAPGDGAEREDRGLTRVEDGRAGIDPEDAHVGDRDGAARHVGGLGAAFARGGSEGADGLGELAHRHPVGVLDVGDDQPAGGGGRDAEVDVVLEHDLLGGLVPGGVDARVAAHREAHRLGQHEQWSHLDVAELPVALELLDEVHGGADVDGDPLGDVRGRERGGDHGLGGHLAHALDGGADLANAHPVGAGPGGDVVAVTVGEAVVRRAVRTSAAAASTSARVTMPPSPVGVTLPRSTPRSLASLRTRRLGQCPDPLSGEWVLSLR